MFLIPSHRTISFTSGRIDRNQREEYEGLGLNMLLLVKLTYVLNAEL